jgi:hypothetical protein
MHVCFALFVALLSDIFINKTILTKKQQQNTYSALTFKLIKFKIK